MVTVAAPFPLLTSVNVMGTAVAPAPVDGNAAVVGDDGANAIVAPLGVTVSGSETFACAGSFVKRVRAPISGVPPVAEPGTVPVMTREPDPPGPMLRLVGLTENADPVVAAEIESGPVPPLVMENIDVTAAPTHPAGPRLIVPAAKTAIAVPASTTGPDSRMSSLASVLFSSLLASTGAASCVLSDSRAPSRIGAALDALDSL